MKKKVQFAKRPYGTEVSITYVSQSAYGDVVVVAFQGTTPYTLLEILRRLINKPLRVMDSMDVQMLAGSLYSITVSMPVYRLPIRAGLRLCEESARYAKRLLDEANAAIDTGSRNAVDDVVCTLLYANKHSFWVDAAISH
jgi:hypothetical protein